MNAKWCKRGLGGREEISKRRKKGDSISTQVGAGGNMSWGE